MTTETAKTKRVRIKVGAQIMHDHMFARWPNCKPPITREGYEYKFMAKDHGMEFNATWKGGYWDCVAPGYGESGNYGNGSIFVAGIDCVEILEDKDESNERQNNNV